MFANPGLSGGRGPSCWPNNRRLKGERRARGAPAPTAAPPTASLPGTDLGAMRGDAARPRGRSGRGTGTGPPLRALLPGPARRWPLAAQTAAPPERDPSFQRRPWPGPSASLGI